MGHGAEWIAVDWGTSNVRAWGIGANGSTVFAAQSDRGMSRLGPPEYPAALADLLAGHEGVSEILICGMAGARQGWREAPYLDAPADLGRLGFGAVRPDTGDTGFLAQILPGVCQKAAGLEDVMRGEETQLLGLSELLPGFSGAVCMPGTHSKWAQVEGRRLVRFETAMTGELFELLKTHSVLRHSLDGELEGPGRPEGFAKGSELGLARPEDLTGLLFKTRAAALLSGRAPDWCAGFLSGLLIGAEIGARRDLIGQNEIPLIGSPALCTLYRLVLEGIGARARVVDAAEVTLLGLKAARMSLAQHAGGPTR